MSKTALALGAATLIILVAAFYFLLSKQVKSPINTGSQTTNPTIQPLTTQNADKSFQKTDEEIQFQVNQMDMDLSSVDEANTKASTSQVDINSINNL